MHKSSAVPVDRATAAIDRSVTGSVYHPVPHKSPPHKLAIQNDKSDLTMPSETRPIPLRWETRVTNGGGNSTKNLSDNNNNSSKKENVQKEEDDDGIAQILVFPSSASESRPNSLALHVQTADLTATRDRRTFSESAAASLSVASSSAEQMQYMYGSFSPQSSLQSGSSLSPTIAADETSSSPPPPLARPRRQYSWRNPKPRNMRRSWSLREGPGEPVSPASKFLAMFNAGQSNVPPASEPDDEGQEVTDYVIGKPLGYGGFSVVKEAHTLVNGTEVTHAVKIVRKSQRRDVGGATDELAQADLDHELTIWRCISPAHPHILQLLSVHETGFATFCFMQYANAGSVFDAVIRKQRSDGFTIPLDVKVRWMFELCSALRFLHQDLRIVHRDVKPENCLLSIEDPNSQTVHDAKLLLCDFGMSEFINVEDDDRIPESGADNSGLSTPDSGLASSVSSLRLMPPSPPPSAVTTAATTTPVTTTEFGLTGSVPYLSPELLVPTTEPTPISPKQDIWALGVFTYVLFTGTLPFSHSFLPNLQRLIAKGDWDQDTLRNASDDAIVDFVARCFAMQRSDRWDIGEVLRHEIFRELTGDK
ncbi:kinase-like domain-containing protein [Lipomyces orientalis]|uniref:Kinase-like domain-containing protein n=1 Tax=Lipomyces orientalis TaxID=1233043 RepID=A0ACC3TSS8_9ASCO